MTTVGDIYSTIRDTQNGGAENVIDSSSHFELRIRGKDDYESSGHGKGALDPLEIKKGRVHVQVGNLGFEKTLS